MVNINLLPWREEERAEKQRQFLSILGLIAVLGAALAFLITMYYSTLLDNQKSRNQFLSSEISKLESIILEIKELESERKDLIARMDIIQNLQRSRPLVVHVFDDVVSIVPEGIGLSLVERRGDLLIFKGIAEIGRSRIEIYSEY